MLAWSRRYRIRRLLSYLLVAGGAVLLFRGGHDLWESHWGQSQAARELESPVPVPRDVAPSAHERLPLGETVAKLSIPRLDAQLYVVEGVDQADLRRGPGHMPGTALPGGNGNCVVAGHRDTHFRVLKGIQKQGRRILVVFDEASAIPDLIWETTEGALTDEQTEIHWLVCGNPTRNNGRFRECFGRYRHRWIRRQVDSRSARLTNKQQIGQWITDYGEESDFVRVRVKGEFPRASSMQFIASDLAEAAMTREAEVTLSDPFVMGVDVARFGDDRSVIVLRP